MLDIYFIIFLINEGYLLTFQKFNQNKLNNISHQLIYGNYKERKTLAAPSPL